MIKNISLSTIPYLGNSEINEASTTILVDFYNYNIEKHRILPHCVYGVKDTSVNVAYKSMSTKK